MSYKRDYEKVYMASLLFAFILMAANLYFYCHPVLSRLGMTAPPLDFVIGRFRSAGAFPSPYPTKTIIIALVVLSTIVRSGKGRRTSMKVILPLSCTSLALYFLPYFGPWTYLLCSLLGMAGVAVSSSLVSRLYGGMTPHDNDMLESFEQERDIHRTTWSVNIPMRFYLRKAWHDGWISVVNPFRGTMVMGLPGSGKSFSVFNPYISQLIGKGFTMMLYDFKMPDLSLVVYNELLRNRDKYPRPPRFYCINFKDPRRSNRCNPIAARYFSEIIDASETARVVMAALNKGNEKKDFFTESAQQYFGICLWELATYTPPGGSRGDWCDIPHVIELINQDYRKVLAMIERNEDLGGKAKLFLDALRAGAQDQLQGQIASVRIPLNDIASPVLYWVLSGDDFSLDINDPENPKVVCLGNDPKRQEVYGTALALFTFRAIKLVNEKGKLPCALLMDELPTVKVEGLDGLMATARSNKVAVVLGIQDISQLVADYGEKTADKILSLPANVFIGQVNGKTAERYSKEFGREFRRQEGQTVNMDSESTNISYHEEEIMPVKKIASLPSGTFIGKVAVDNGTDMKQNFFCASIRAEGMEGELQPLPVLTDFHLETVSQLLEDRAFADAKVMDWLDAQICREWSTPDVDADGAELPVRPRTDDEIIAERDRRFTSLSSAERDRILETVRKEMEDEKIRRVLDDNYRKIRSDIERMLEENSFPEDESMSSGDDMEEDYDE